MKKRITLSVSVLITVFTFASLAAPAEAATAPETAERKRAEAKNAFKLNILKVYVEETDGFFKDVLMEAKVTEVLRTTCGVKVGETVLIKSRRRHMTDEQVRNSKESFSKPPLVIRKGWRGTAFLRLKDGTSSLKTFGIVLEGFSFVAKKSQTSRNNKPDTERDCDERFASALKELEAIIEESRPAASTANRRAASPKTQRDGGSKSKTTSEACSR